jgi:hypothetical protein
MHYFGDHAEFDHYSKLKRETCNTVEIAQTFMIIC